ncbi:MAG: hypothetical protein Kow0069_04730 [Promethearchaeota archaeon]
MDDRRLGRRLAGLVKGAWTGRASPRDHALYVAGVLVVYFAGVVVSASVYPGGFSPLRVYVSYLGGSEENPAGHVVYNACTLVAGVLLFPHFGVLIPRRMAFARRPLRCLTGAFGSLGTLGFASLGVFYQGTPEALHGAATYLAFGGFGAALFIALLAVLADALSGNPRVVRVRVAAVVYGLALAILAGALLLDQFGEALLSGLVDPAFYGNRFMEWWYFSATLVGVCGLPSVLPAARPQPPSSNSNRNR